MTIAVTDSRRLAPRASLSVETLEGREVPGGWGGACSGWGGSGGRWGGWDGGSSWSHRSDSNDGDGQSRSNGWWSGHRSWRSDSDWSWKPADHGWRSDSDWSSKAADRTWVAQPPRGDCPKPPPPPTCQPPVDTSSQVGGFVYQDANRDGQFQAGEQLLEGVQVTLTGTAQNGTVVNTSATTSATGTYNFSGLATGTYTIAITSPPGLLPGHAAVGDFGGTTGVNTVTGIAAVAGQTSSGYNFGLELPRDR